jgi:hypothetical protein
VSPLPPSIDPLAAFGRPPDDGYDDLDIPVPTRWTDLTADAAPAAWVDLRGWADRLRDRFGLDHHVLPPCWWRHNAHVEALVALRDHEAASYLDTAPATAPVDWFRAVRDITALLRGWTAELSCDTTHRPSPNPLQPPTGDQEWAEHLAADVARRTAAAEVGNPEGAADR